MTIRIDMVNYIAELLGRNTHVHHSYYQLCLLFLACFVQKRERGKKWHICHICPSKVVPREEAKKREIEKERTALKRSSGSMN